MALDIVVQAMVTEEDLNALAKAAKAEDRSVSAYLRRLIRDDLREKGLLVSDEEEEDAVAG